MIGPLNYAAQAETQLRNHYNPIYKGRETDIKIAEIISDSLSRSVHFRLPDDGIIFDDNLKGIKGSEIKLPYNNITLEYNIVGTKYGKDEPEKTVSKRRLILCEQGDYSIVANVIKCGLFKEMGYAFLNMLSNSIMATTFYYIDNKWAVSPIGFLMQNAWESVPYASTNIKYPYTVGLMPFTVMPGMEHQLASEFGKEKVQAIYLSENHYDVTALLEFCEAISCCNVSSEIIQHEDKVANKKRQAKNKLPLYETRVLTVSLPSKSTSTSSGYAFAERNSPRQHLRRGHIRRLDDNRKIWVNSCVVGKSENGIIDKSYNITTLH